MEETVLISICIPAYKRVSYLKRLLDSIGIQTYRHFEVVVTDDSPDNAVFELTRDHELRGSIRYFKNVAPLGTPENWNESLRHATGEWIKLMHDDDWFAGPDALKIYAEAILKNPDRIFFFSAYTNVFLDKNTREQVHISESRLNRLERNPHILLSRNLIGPPSVILHKKNSDIYYDSSLKWLVDIDFYIRVLKNVKPIFIPRYLIEVGIGEEQVTRQVFRNPSVEIPENLYLLNKWGTGCLKNWVVYDAFWRFIRNLNIRSVDQIRRAGYEKDIPPVIESMISFQASVPGRVLKTGVFSKLLMFTHYISQYIPLTRG